MALENTTADEYLAFQEEANRELGLHALLPAVGLPGRICLDGYMNPWVYIGRGIIVHHHRGAQQAGHLEPAALV
jgi:hypothetical protein